jgi:hypothetical protein
MDMQAFSFTGSSRTGRLIRAAAAKFNPKQILLELGSKSPAIVFEDADQEKTVKEMAHSIQWNSSQVCMASSRIYVRDTIADKYIELFKQNFEKVVKMGDPLDAREKGVNPGPQADEAQHETVLQYLGSGKQSGSELVPGGGAPPNREGCYIQPTIFKNRPEDAKVVKEEIFGSVVNIERLHIGRQGARKSQCDRVCLTLRASVAEVKQTLTKSNLGMDCMHQFTLKPLIVRCPSPKAWKLEQLVSIVPCQVGNGPSAQLHMTHLLTRRLNV